MGIESIHPGVHSTHSFTVNSLTDCSMGFGERGIDSTYLGLCLGSECAITKTYTSLCSIINGNLSKESLISAPLNLPSLTYSGTRGCPKALEPALAIIF